MEPRGSRECGGQAQGESLGPDASCAVGRAVSLARPARERAFDSLHSSVVVGYAALSLAFIMLAFQPVLIAIALAGSLATGCLLSGWREVRRGLAWQLPLLVVAALANALFSPMGTSALAHVGAWTLYGESLAYGACMGAMLVTVFVQFANVSLALTSDRVMLVLGGRLPTVALVVSMATRLVPQFVRRGHEVSSVRAACSAARPRTARDRAAAHVRVASVLMGWGMEDSLETADAMRCRAWGRGVRTAYRRHDRLMRRDALALAVVLLLAALCAVLAFAATSQFRFYPSLSTLVLWWGYLPYAVFFFLPTFVLIGGYFSWKR